MILCACALVDPAQQRLVHEVAEVLLVEPHQHAVGEHGHRGIALGLGDQRLLAEGVTDAELGELDAFLVERRLARHQAAALHDGVEVVAFVTLLDDDFAGAVLLRGSCA